MKGLNVKRIAAIGLGAALVGSALAPAVMAAAAFSNLDTLTKSDIISATGAPVVDIVVGTIGQPADVIWAGNIAAKVAQMAVVPTGTATGKTVDFTVNGTATTTGQGNTVDASLLSAAGLSPTEFNPVDTTSTDMPSLVNDASWKYKYAGSDTTISVKEQLDANVTLAYQDDASSSAYAPGQLLAEVSKGTLTYTISLGDGFPSGNATNMDSNSQTDITVPVLGQTYTVDSIANSGKDLVLFSSTSPSTLNVGQSVTVSKADTNKTYTLVLKDITKTQDAADYKAAFDLMDGTTVVDSKTNIAQDTDLKDTFGDKFDSSVYVTFVGASIVTGGSAYVNIRTGTSRLEIKDGSAFPYTGDSTTDNKALWQASITTANSKVTKIVISNKVAYTKTSGSETDSTKFALKIGDSVMLPSNFAKMTFVGLVDKPLHTIEVGAVSGISAGGIQYPDYKGTEINVPFMYSDISLDLNSSGTSGPQYYSDIGQDGYTLWLGTGSGNDAKLYYIKGDQSTATSTAGFSAVDITYGVPSADIALDFGAQSRSSTNDTIAYKFVTNSAATKQALLLSAQAFDVYDKSNVNGELKFNGTDVSDSGAVTNAYYVPDDTSLNGMLNSPALDSSDKTYMVASVQLAEDANFNSPNDVNFFVQTGSTGKELDIDAISSDLSNYTRDATMVGWTDSIRQSADYLQTGATLYGTQISADGSTFTIQMPEELRKAEMYLGGTSTSTTTTGGTPYTGVGVGQTQGGVTVTSISGATTGVSVVKVGNIVVSDQASASGKSILVGGWLANTKVAADLALPNGTKLNEVLKNNGDYVDAVLTDGSVLVAGWTASDTASAAQDLITALDGLQ